MKREELLKEIEAKENEAKELKYKFSILSMDTETLWAFIQLKDEKIKELQEKLEEIKNIVK